MAKYDFDLEFYQKPSASILMNMIKPNSIVLEFGSSNGRMTRYMKEHLGCKVYIVEYNAEAFEEALQYAEDGISGNILEYEWLDKFKDIKFDTIMFANVIEHLYNHDEVLEKCQYLLKNDGNMLISAPNIAHNSVIIDLINNKFAYSSIDLLDDTHIRFFTYSSLVETLSIAGFTTVEERGTYLPPWKTEFQNNYHGLDSSQKHLLVNKKFGEVYQFVFSAMKSDYLNKNKESVVLKKLIKENAPYDKATLYLLKNNQYSEDGAVSQFIREGENDLLFDLSDVGDVFKTRFDFCDDEAFIKVVEISINNSIIDINSLDGNYSKKYDNEYIFINPYPYFILESTTAIKSIVIKFSFDRLYDYNNIVSFYDRIYMLNTQKNDIEINQRKEELNIKLFEHKKLKKANYLLETNVYDLNYKLSKLNRECSSIRANFDKLSTDHLDLINHYTGAINDREILTADKQQYEHLYHTVVSSFFWRMSKPFRKIAGLFDKKTLGTPQETENDATEKNLSNALIDEKDKGYQSKYKFNDSIKFSILAPLYNTSAEYLKEMIYSVQNQTYSNWELCLADGSDDEYEYVGAHCLKLIGQDSRIKYKKLEKNEGISGNTNRCIEMATGDYIALLDHDDYLHPSALFEYALVINNEQADFIYCDENTFKEFPSDAFCPHYKPDFSPDTLRSYNYITHFSVFSSSLQKEAGLFNPDMDGIQDYDMILRLSEKAENIYHIPQILYFRRAHEESVSSIGAKAYTAIKAIGQHLDRIGLEYYDIEFSCQSSSYKINYKTNDEPLISIIIPNKDSIEILSKCLESIEIITSYSNYEIIIVENNSTEEETFEYYESLNHNEKIKVIFWKKGFNYPAINNFGVSFARGEYILLLNNDIEVINSEWIQEMLMFAQRKDVGAVGAKLYYPDNTIQHAGVVLGIGGIAGHSHKYYHRSELGYAGRLRLVQNISAVTGACLMIKKNIFEEVGGLEPSFRVAFNDIDFCLRVIKAGYINIFTPFAELYHHESKTRGFEDTPEKIARFQSEICLFEGKWYKELADGDPFYNPNLTLEKEDFSFKK